MKNKLKFSPWLGLPLVVALMAPLTSWAGDEAKVEKRVEVVVAGEGRAPMPHDHHAFTSSSVDHNFGESAGPVTFLGIETARVSPALAAQFGLGRGMGLVVQRIVPDTPAAAVLKKHDVLTLLDDQMLVGSDQLGILVRSKNPGDEVTLTFFRDGEKQTVDVALGERKAKTVHVLESSSVHAAAGSDSGNVRVIRKQVHDEHGNISVEEVEALMGGLKEKRGDGLGWVDNGASPVVRMLNINDGTVVFTDEAGTVKLLSGDGQKRLVVVDPEDEVIFDGPVDSEEERAALDTAIKRRLEKVESINAMQLEMDGDFEVEDDVHVVVPHASVDFGEARVTKPWLSDDPIR